jgi:hypothetical protein
MTKLKFSKTAIDKLPFSTIGQVDYWDTDIKGLGLSVMQNHGCYLSLRTRPRSSPP